MTETILFFATSILLGIALAMDAFSVSLTVGLREPHIKKERVLLAAGMFGGFQFLMPLLGRLGIGTLLKAFGKLQDFIPVIAFLVLLVLGVKMLLDGIKAKEKEEPEEVSKHALILQGVATSLDALSVGFTVFAEYSLLRSVTASLLIGGVTFLLCILGVLIGRKVGTVLKNKAFILGGIILIAIGIEILIKG